MPVPFDNYDGLSPPRGSLLYVEASRPPSSAASRRDAPALQVFTFEGPQGDDARRGRRTATPSPADGTKVLVARRRASCNLYDASAEGQGLKKTVSTAGLVVDRVPAGGVGGDLRRGLAPLPRLLLRREHARLRLGGAAASSTGRSLAHVGHRSDLNYVIGEMIAELNVGHAYVAGGDFQLPDAAAGGPARRPLRARRRRRAATGSRRSSAARTRRTTYRSPLTEVGVDVKEGDYVLAIDGDELAADDNPYRLLRHKADRPVRLTVNGQPTLEGRARGHLPAARERGASLIYLDWVTRQPRARRQADRTAASATSTSRTWARTALREFIKWFYRQVRKEGLIVDVRTNGGGNVSQTHHRAAAAASCWRSTSAGCATTCRTTYPPTVFHGHMACLINETSALGRRHLPVRCSAGGPGPADRQAHLGRRRRHLAAAAR